MKNKNTFNLKTVVSIGLLLLLIVVISPQIHVLKDSVNQLKNASKVFILLALGAQFLNYVSSTFVYLNLSKKPLGFKKTLLVEWAGGFTNRLLPAGLGALGLSALYLTKNRHSVSQASAIVLLNNFLGLVGNMLLLAVLLFITPVTISFSLSDKTKNYVFILLPIIFLIIALASKLKPFRRRVSKTKSELSQILNHYIKKPDKLFKALLASLCITLCHSAVLYFSARSLGAPIGLSGALLAMSGGNLAGAITPTPGGLVGVEAGLTASLVAQGVDAPSALAIALLYRFFTYWFPIIPGFICFKIAQNHKYI